MRSPALALVLVAAVVVWLVVTVVAVIAVLLSPRENVGLALGMALGWTVLILLASRSRRGR